MWLYQARCTTGSSLRAAGANAVFGVERRNAAVRIAAS